MGKHINYSPSSCFYKCRVLCLFELNNAIFPLLKERQKGEKKKKEEEMIRKKTEDLKKKKGCKKEGRKIWKFE